MDRFSLTDVQWDQITDIVPGKPGDPGRSGKDNRLFLEAVLWIARVGAPWRDLPANFGHWNSVFKRFRRWALAGVFDRIFAVLRGDPDFEYVIADGTIVRVHQKGTGARGDSESCDRTLARRVDQQDHGAGRWLGEPDQFHSNARAAPRQQGYQTSDR